MKNDFGYAPDGACIAFRLDGYYVWDCSVIKSGGKFRASGSADAPYDFKDKTYIACIKLKKK